MSPAIPTLFRAAGREPQTYRTLSHLAEDLAALLTADPDNPRELVLKRGMATYPGFDTFPVFSVHGRPWRGLAMNFGRDTWLCAVAIQATPPQDLDELVTKAIGRRAPNLLPYDVRQPSTPQPRPIAVRAGAAR